MELVPPRNMLLPDVEAVPKVLLLIRMFRPALASTEMDFHMGTKASTSGPAKSPIDEPLLALVTPKKMLLVEPVAKERRPRTLNRTVSSWLMMLNLPEAA